jgi:DNA-binding MarR family transcriptional regulator
MHKARIKREERLAELGRSAFMLMAELESLGPASASDKQLLQRLGWTRSRAVQVFRQLEEAGLVTSETVKGDSGRPRKVYRPAELVTAR